MNQEQVTEDLVRQNGNQAAAVMADYASQGGGDQPTPTPPPYTPNPRFDIDTILSGFPLSDKVGEQRYIGDALGFPFTEKEDFSDMVSGMSLIGSYYYSGESEDFSLPIGFGAGNYLCYAIFSYNSAAGMLYMAPVETMAFKSVASLSFNDNDKVWDVYPVN